MGYRPHLVFRHKNRRLTFGEELVYLLTYEHKAFGMMRNQHSKENIWLMPPLTVAEARMCGLGMCMMMPVNMTPMLITMNTRADKTPL